MYMACSLGKGTAGMATGPRGMNVASENVRKAVVVGYTGTCRQFEYRKVSEGLVVHHPRL
jgi:hypothetical protein